MTELLLELLSEEMPSSQQLKAAKDFKKDFARLLSDSKINYFDIETYSTPRRITLHVSNVDKLLKGEVEEKRGPRVGANEKAIEGFLKSTNLTIDDLVKKETPKGEFYFAIFKTESRQTSDVLTKIINNYIGSYSWSKSMRWGNHDIRWIRPLQNILCVFDEKILDVKFGHILANNKTCGHRFLGSKNIVANNFAEYKEKLKDNFVVLSHEERKQIIFDKSNKLASFNNIELKRDLQLEDEVAGLVEYPFVLLGKIDSKFMSLPEEVLTTSMKSHQKYFSLINENGNLAPFFIVVANISSENDEDIIQGNQKVLSARLEDAKFFWDNDLKLKLADKVEKLSAITFHAKLGTLSEKVKRITELAKLISVWIPHANLLHVERAAELCKADLTTEMVHEFPELQGVMGCYYAIESNESPEVSLAMKNHYKPNGANDSVPIDPVSIAVSLADKIDSLVGLFAVGEIPSGSKDPYALRRNALGIIRIILENKLNIPLKLLADKSINIYPKNLFKSEEKLNPKKIIADTVKGKSSKKRRQEKIFNQIIEFLFDRLKVIVKEKNIDPDIIKAVFEGSKEDDITKLVELTEIFQKNLYTEEGQSLLSAYKRSHNIVNAAIKKDDDEYEDNIDKFLFEVDEEKRLYEALSDKSPIIEGNLKKENYEKAILELFSLSVPINNFLDNVIVNHDEYAVRKNRLCLINKFNKLINKVGKLSYLN